LIGKKPPSNGAFFETLRFFGGKTWFCRLARISGLDR